jgi:hypothetical protein
MYLCKGTTVNTCIRPVYSVLDKKASISFFVFVVNGDELCLNSAELESGRKATLCDAYPK